MAVVVLLVQCFRAIPDGIIVFTLSIPAPPYLMQENILRATVVPNYTLTLGLSGHAHGLTRHIFADLRLLRQRVPKPSCKNRRQAI